MLWHKHDIKGRPQLASVPKLHSWRTDVPNLHQLHLKYARREVLCLQRSCWVRVYTIALPTMATFKLPLQAEHAPYAKFIRRQNIRGCQILVEPFGNPVEWGN